MANISLTGNFEVIPEGTYVFKITKVEYKEEFGKLTVTLQTQNGDKHVERFMFLKKDGSENNGAKAAFSYFARIAMQDQEAEEIDTDDLIGRFIECDIEHDVVPSKTDSNKVMRFAHIADKRESDGWEETPKQTSAKPKYDIHALLNS